MIILHFGNMNSIMRYVIVDPIGVTANLARVVKFGIVDFGFIRFVTYIEIV